MVLRSDYDPDFTGADLGDPLLVKLAVPRHQKCMGALHSRACMFVNEALDLVSATPMCFDELFDLANIRMVVNDDEPLTEVEAAKALWSCGLFNIQPGNGYVSINP